MGDLLKKVLTDKSVRNPAMAKTVAVSAASDFAPWQGVA